VGEVLILSGQMPHTSEILSLEDFVSDGAFRVFSCYSEEFCYLTENGVYKAQIGNFDNYTKKSGKKGQVAKSDDGNFIERYHFFDETRSTVPRHLLFMKTLYASYDFKTQEISYYRSFEERNS
jgi:hypothetical protein